MEASIRNGASTLRFAIENERDTVQRCLAAGGFYEPDQLAFHRQMVFAGSTVLDVGANVGNHAMYYATMTQASRVYPFEPNPAANRLLRATAAMNRTTKLDLSYADLGVGAREEERHVGAAPADNLGGVRLLEAPDPAGAPHRVRVVPLDSLTLIGPVSLLKIDVEGMEMDVLAGAQALIAKRRPCIALEVDNANLPAFWDWIDAHAYHVVNAFKSYWPNINYVCIPKSPAPAV